MASKTLGRRRFLTGLGAAAAGAAALRPLFTIAAEGAKGANDRLGVGFVGTGGRCHAHMDIVLHLKQQGEAIGPVAVCDVYGPRAQAAAQKTGGKPYRNHRDLCADPNVDIVCIASPDRHHAPQALDAVRAGKDVYCEKPLTHWTQFDLARQLAEEAEKNKRVVQVGTQYMTGNAHAQAAELIKQGVIGKIVHVQAGFFRRGDWGEAGMPIPDRNAQPGPDLDWDGFLGDAPKVPFSVDRFFRWRLFWDYAGGPSTDLLVHTFTPVFRCLDLGYPERVFGGGGKFHYNDLREVPDQFNMIIDYPGGPSVIIANSLSNETILRYPHAAGGEVFDTIIRGTNGICTFERQGIIIHPFGEKQPTHTIPWGGMGNTGLLWTDLIACVRTRTKLPLSPVSVGAKVQAPLNMAILSYRENKVARFDPQNLKIIL
jgi:predicted dehydrogenase